MNGLSACPEASAEVVHEHRQAGLSSKHKGVEEHRNHAGTMSAHPDAPVYSGPRLRWSEGSASYNSLVRPSRSG
jgi:hypothetical protein